MPLPCMLYSTPSCPCVCVSALPTSKSSTDIPAPIGNVVVPPLPAFYFAQGSTTPKHMQPLIFPALPFQQSWNIVAAGVLGGRPTVHSASTMCACIIGP